MCSGLGLAYARRPRHRRSSAILRVEDVIDPTTACQFKVESGSNSYWIDQRGTVLGTDTDTRPNLDFRQLIQLP